MSSVPPRPPPNPYRKSERWLWFLLVMVLAVTLAGADTLVRRWPRPTPIVIYPPPVLIETDSHQPKVPPAAEQSNPSITIMISGAVQQPGLYSLAAGATVGDAILRAGGLTEAADSSTLRQEEALSDGAVLHIPALTTSRIQPED